MIQKPEILSPGRVTEIIEKCKGKGFPTRVAIWEAIGTQNDYCYKKTLEQIVEWLKEKAIRGSPGMDGEPMWISIQLNKEDLQALTHK